MGDFETELVGSGALLLAEFGESITYDPATGADRAITAIVHRQGPDELTGLPSGRAERLEIEVRNDAANGISSAEVNTGGDFITVAARIGDTAASRRITKIISQDTEMLRLEVQ
jgi:hypothetical protein